MLFLRKIFNLWIPYPLYKPKESGWYICSIRYGDEKDQAYVMDLYWNKDINKWVDNRRKNVFDVYNVYDSKHERISIMKDNLIYRKDIVAFKNLPNKYK